MTRIGPFGRLIAFALYLGLAFHMGQLFLSQPNHFVGADFSIYHEAYLEAAGGGNPYQPLQIGVSYINHPYLLSFVGLFHRLGGMEGTKWLWIVLSAAIWVWVVWRIVRLVCPPDPATLEPPKLGPPKAGRESRSDELTLGLALLAFAPGWETLLTGQVNILAMLSLVLMLILDLRGKPWWAGACLALAFVLKISPGAFVLFYLVLGRWRVLGGAFIGLVLLTAISMLQFGSGIMAQWLEVLPQLGSVVRNSQANQSILALAYRQLEPLGWNGLRPTLLLLHKAGFLSLLGYLLWWSYRLRGSDRSTQVWLFAGMLTLIVVFSPLLWLHHSTFLALPLALMFFHPEPRIRRLALACFFLIQADRLFELAVTRHAWPVLLAHGLIVWAMLRELPRLAASEPGSPAPPRRS